jgi:hypothetical protein
LKVISVRRKGGLVYVPYRRIIFRLPSYEQVIAGGSRCSNNRKKDLIEVKNTSAGGRSGGYEKPAMLRRKTFCLRLLSRSVVIILPPFAFFPG